MIEQINRDNIPEHIAVIMDGNGRWAKKQGAARIFGHRHAIKAVKDVTEGCAELGVGFLTLYAFSTENWARPQAEVDGLMNLLVSTIIDEIGTLHKNNVRLSTIGNISRLPEKAARKLAEAKEETKSNKGLNLILALNYSGRWDIENAMRLIAEKVERGEMDSKSVCAATISEHLSTNGIPDPSLLIRTSGEMRISNFLLWEMAYTEMLFTNVLWPDFRKNDLIEAILSYQQRERRFGKISEQLNNG